VRLSIEVTSGRPSSVDATPADCQRTASVAVDDVPVDEVAVDHVAADGVAAVIVRRLRS
jgi:hypothetical protein